MLSLNAIIWSANPDFFVIPGLNHPIRWYGLLFALGFIMGQMIFQYIYKSEGKSKKDLESLLIYVVAGTVLGARLGHCLFYDPGYYLSNPIEILFIWKGGLASHGGGIGLFLALYLYARKHKDQPYVWLLDRMVIIVALAGACIRTGNFMNSEIIGKSTGTNYGVVFARNFEEALIESGDGIESVNFKTTKEEVTSDGLIPIEVQATFEKGKRYTTESLENYFNQNIAAQISRYRSLKDHIRLPEAGIDAKAFQKRNRYTVSFKVYGVARQPAQLYEAIYCVFIFLLIFHIWYHHRQRFSDGFLFGLFMAILFTLRFVDEFFKENQEAFEDGMVLNMGQMLSIPFVGIGLFFIIRSLAKSRKQEANTISDGK